MAMERMILKINGAERSFICDREKDTLSDVIRNLGLTGTKVGCGKGQCGACNVILNGKLVRSCTRKMKSVDEYSTVLTIEGLGTAENLHPLQLAWMLYGGVQCGFCSPGFIVSAKALLNENDHPTREEVRDWFLKNRNACRCTGYKPLVDAVMAAAEVIRGEKTMKEMWAGVSDDQVFGTRAPKPTALGKVLGTTDYGDDIALKHPDMLHLAPVMPKVSHAKIKSIDISEAEKADGVVKVITAKDVKGTNRTVFGVGTNWSKADGSERPILCDEKIFHYGDIVALVAADTRRHAREAAELVKVEWEQLPEYMNALDAVAEDAIEIHPGIPNMFLEKALIAGDDPRPIMDKAAHVVEFSTSTQRQPHLPIEPDCANAFIDKDGVVTIMLKTHNLYANKGFLSTAIGVPPEKIRAILNPTGGSFGYSFTPGTAALVAVATLATGRPVSLTFSYEEHMVFTGKRAPAFANGRIACDENGKLLAGEMDMLFDQGCYSETAGGGPLNTQKFFLTPYVCPSARTVGRVTFSNTPYNTAYRAPYVPSIYALTEQMMDMLAEKAGLDPLEFRERNVWREGDTAVWGEKPRVYVMPGIIDALKPKYEALKKHAKEASTDDVKYGVGIAFGSFNVSTNADKAEVALELNPDGTVTHFNTWEDMGQGADIGALAFAHESLKPLGLRPDQIRLVMNDTETCPDTGRAAASRCNIMTSITTKKAADQLLNAMRKEDGTYRTYDEMVAEGIPTKYTGFHQWEDNKKLNENNGFGCFPPDQSYSAFLSEVAVETATGKVSVVEMHDFTDVGEVTNWLSLEGQAYSGMMHSLGYALYEDNTDPLKQTNLISSGFPYIDVVPDGEHFTMTNVGTYREYSGHGGSGCSETFQSAGHAAILNAIYQAVGVRVHEQPARPALVKEAMDRKARGEADDFEPFFLGSDFYDELEYIETHPRVEYSGDFVDH